MAAIIDILGGCLMAQLGEPQPGGQLAVVAEAPFAVEQQRQPFGMGEPLGFGIGASSSNALAMPASPIAFSRSRVGC
jgi:hypothetical protein